MSETKNFGEVDDCEDVPQPLSYDMLQAENHLRAINGQMPIDNPD